MHVRNSDIDTRKIEGIDQKHGPYPNAAFFPRRRANKYTIYASRIVLSVQKKTRVNIQNGIVDIKLKSIKAEDLSSKCGCCGRCGRF